MGNSKGRSQFISSILRSYQDMASPLLHLVVGLAKLSHILCQRSFWSERQPAFQLDEINFPTNVCWQANLGMLENDSLPVRCVRTTFNGTSDTRGNPSCIKTSRLGVSSFVSQKTSELRGMGSKPTCQFLKAPIQIS